MCDGKRIYKNKGIALRATHAPRFKQRKGHPLLAYKCPDGGGWHIGHRSQGHRQIARDTLSRMNPPDMEMIEARAKEIRQRQTLISINWQTEWAEQRERFIAYADIVTTELARDLQNKKKRKSYRTWITIFDQFAV